MRGDCRDAGVEKLCGRTDLNEFADGLAMLALLLLGLRRQQPHTRLVQAGGALAGVIHLISQQTNVAMDGADDVVLTTLGLRDHSVPSELLYPALSQIEYFGDR